MTVYNKNGGRSYSDTLCVQAYKIYFPPPIRNTTTSIIDSSAQLNWVPLANVESNAFFIQKQIGDDIFATIDTVNNPAYIDLESVFEEGPFCYTINYLDECNNRSNIGDLTCSIHLSFK